MFAHGFRGLHPHASGLVAFGLVVAQCTTWCRKLPTSW